MFKSCRHVDAFIRNCCFAAVQPAQMWQPAKVLDSRSVHQRSGCRKSRKTAGVFIRWAASVSYHHWSTALSNYAMVLRSYPFSAESRALSGCLSFPDQAHLLKISRST